MSGEWVLIFFSWGVFAYQLIKMSGKYDTLKSEKASQEAFIKELITANRSLVVKYMEDAFAGSDERVTVFRTQFIPSEQLMHGVVGDEHLTIPYSARPAEYQEAVLKAYSTWRTLREQGYRDRDE